MPIAFHELITYLLLVAVLIFVGHYMYVAIVRGYITYRDLAFMEPVVVIVVVLAVLFAITAP